MQGAQIGVGAVREGCRLDDAARVEKLRLAIQVMAEAERVDAAATGVTGIFQDSQTERYFGVGALVTCQLGALIERRQAKRGSIETPITSAADLREDGPGRCAEPVGVIQTGSF